MPFRCRSMECGTETWSRPVRSRIRALCITAFLAGAAAGLLDLRSRRTIAGGERANLAPARIEAPATTMRRLITALRRERLPLGPDPSQRNPAMRLRLCDALGQALANVRVLGSVDWGLSDGAGSIVLPPTETDLVIMGPDCVPVRVRAGPAVASVTASRTPGHEFTGILLDQAGRPVPGADVLLSFGGSRTSPGGPWADGWSLESVGPGLLPRTYVAAATTDAGGRFAFSRLLGGRHDLSIAPECGVALDPFLGVDVDVPHGVPFTLRGRRICVAEAVVRCRCPHKGKHDARDVRVESGTPRGMRLPSFHAEAWVELLRHRWRGDASGRLHHVAMYVAETAEDGPCRVPLTWALSSGTGDVCQAEVDVRPLDQPAKTATEIELFATCAGHGAVAAQSRHDLILRSASGVVYTSERTGADVAFSVPAGSYRVGAARAGFLDPRVFEGVGDVVVRADETMRFRLPQVLDETPRLSVRVVDASGVPTDRYILTLDSSHGNLTVSGMRRGTGVTSLPAPSGDYRITLRTVGGQVIRETSLRVDADRDVVMSCGP